MMRRFLTIAGAVLALAAAPVALATQPNLNGTYKGKVNQTDLFKHHYGTIQFTVHKRAITKLTMAVGVNCTDGKAFVDQYTPHGLHIPIKAGGKFSLVRQKTGTKFEINGQIKGRKATGKVREAFKDPAHGTCTMFFMEPFSAKR